MSPLVHLLNIDNDGALAADSPVYTPPAHARELQRDLELLPVWWASDGDRIIADSHSDARIAAMAREAGVDVERCRAGADAVPAPWGWSRNAAAILKTHGVGPDRIPAEAGLAAIRRLSHRATAIEINRRLAGYGFETPNEPRLLTSADELASIMAHDSRLLLKRPWSSSGRGIFPTDTLTSDQTLRLASGIIRRQGAVTVERLLDKTADFSALFHASGGRVIHRAWSRFFTTGDGRYEGNLIASDSEILSGLGYDTDRLHRLASTLEEILTDITGPYYAGWLGIDMLLYGRTDGTTGLAPCIEMNLRMTMGVAAHLLSRRSDFEGRPHMMRVMAADAPLRPGTRVLTPGGEKWIMVAEKVPAQQ